MTHPTVIVVGTGRSGTSNTARILHEMGICMGHHMKMSPPYGHHEDYLAHGLNMMIANNTLSAEEWLRVMNDCHAGCEKWGAKDPWFLYWSHEQLKVLNPKLIIRTWRPLEATLESWARIRVKMGADVETYSEHIRKVYIERERLADSVERNGFNVVRIRYDQRRTDEEIIAQIERGLAA